jgi:CheY-like chemotaxis protein
MHKKGGRQGAKQISLTIDSGVDCREWMGASSRFAVVRMNEMTGRCRRKIKRLSPTAKQRKWRMNEDITVLIVDDYPSFRQALADALAFIAPSWQIVEAGDGQQGLTLAQRLRPDLILLDLHMPVMNGYEMAVACQRDPALAAIPRVLLTSEEINHPLVKRLQLICHAIVSKPVSISDLASALQRVLG